MSDPIIDTIQKNALKQLLEAIREFIPRYQAPEDMLSGEIDYHKMSQDLSFFFPWPVAYEINKLFRPEFSRYDANRLDQIIKAFERLLQFYAYCLIADLYQQIKFNELRIPEGFAKDFRRRFMTISIGNLAWMVESIIKLFVQAEASPFMSECRNLNTGDFFSAIRWIVPERNNKGHYKFDESPESIEQKCPVYFENLFNLLCRLAFLTKYHLFSVQEIRVNKNRMNPPQFVHQTMYLHSMQKGRPYTWLAPDFVENHAVIICKDVKNLKSEYLNLSPLIIDTNMDLKEIICSDDPGSIAKMKRDIFLYSRYDGNKRLEYTGTTATYEELKSGIDLTVLKFYDQLLNELNDLLTIITQKSYENQESI